MKPNLTDEAKDKIAEYQNALKCIENFHAKVEKIIEDVYHESMDEIVYIDFDDSLDYADNMLHVCYSYGDGYGRETIGIPHYWLNDGFDYVADYKRIKKQKAEANRKKREQAKKTKEEKERAEYERLKKKFEGQ